MLGIKQLTVAIESIVFFFHIMEVNCSVSNIRQNIFFCAQQMKETRSRTGLK